MTLPTIVLATVVHLETPLGSFRVELFDDVAPQTVENFLNYVADGDYENSFVHRKIDGFIVQGGGFTFENDVVDNVPADPPVVNEFNLSNVRGTIAMAKLAGDPDSATSEWFINLADNSANLDNQNGGFTVFGQVIDDGMDVVDAIASLQSWNLQNGFTDTPLIDYTNQGPVQAENLVFTEITVWTPDRTHVDISDVTDVSGDAVPDVAVLSQPAGARPRIGYYSGANRQKSGQVNYLSSAWIAIASATVADGNQDGVRDDPAVAVLGQNVATNKLFVQVRSSDGGVAIAGINALSAAWSPVDVLVIDDANGDGVSDDTAIGILGSNPNRSFRQRNLLQVRRLSDGSVLQNIYFANGGFAPLAAGTVPRTGKSPLLGVLVEKISTQELLVQARVLSDGSLNRNIAFLSSPWRARDLAILGDSDGNGVFNDASYLVLAINPANGKNVVQIRRPGGAFVKNVFVLTDQWQARRMTRIADISGNLFEEIGVLGDRNNDNEARVQLKDFATGTTLGSVSP